MLLIKDKPSKYLIELAKRHGIDVSDNVSVEDLFEEGFFRTPVTAIDVAHRTTKRGIILSERVKERVIKKLYSLVNQKKLAKFKQSGKSVYQER